MVALQSGIKFVTGHILAGSTLIVGALLVMMACYLFGIATSSDGIDNPVAVVPEFLMLMFLTGCVAVAVSTGCFLASTLLTAIRSKRPFKPWLPVVLSPIFGFPIAYSLFGRSDSQTFALVVAFALSACFALYWTVLVSSGALVDFLAGRKAAHENEE